MLRLSRFIWYGGDKCYTYTHVATTIQILPIKMRLCDYAARQNTVDTGNRVKA